MTGLLREQLGVILKITPVVSAMILLMNSASWEYWEYFSSRVRTRGREEPALRGWFCDVFSRIREEKYSQYSHDCIYALFFNDLGAGVILKITPKLSRNAPVFLDRERRVRKNG